MKKLFVTLMAATLMLTFGASAASAQSATGTVTGKAVRWNGEAISGATIRVLAGPLETDKELSRTTTGADGSYAVTLPADQSYWVHIDTLGTWWGYSYQTPFTVRAGETISQVF
ncbi:MAG TPA: carboxypeptidase-like regulatory domain-containing protein, partial [Chloroflexia bacterium]|nr:carboxypeptidase-like regulatory domain-containing protein [Chloroflexia bacterium]